MSAPNRRISTVATHLTAAPSTEPAAGVLSWLQRLIGGIGVASGPGREASGPIREAAPAGGAPVVDSAVAVRGVVKQCFLADEDWVGAEAQSDPEHADHYYRQKVDSIGVQCDAEMLVIPPSHRGLKDRIPDPNERALMMTTTEGYEKLRSALPFAAETLSADAVGPLGPRPGSGENFYVDGLSQGELCIGDIFAVEGTSTVLEVATPRRPCDKWNKVHSVEHSSMFHGPVEENVRHFALTNALVRASISAFPAENQNQKVKITPRLSRL